MLNCENSLSVYHSNKGQDLFVKSHVHMLYSVNFSKLEISFSLCCIHSFDKRRLESGITMAEQADSLPAMALF